MSVSFRQLYDGIWFRYSEIKGCGANKPGGGGFSAGNTCARGGKSSVNSETIDKLDAIPRVSRSGTPKKDGEWIKNPLPRTPSTVETEMEDKLKEDMNSSGYKTERDYLRDFGTMESVSLDLLESPQSIANIESTRLFLKQPPSATDSLSVERPVTVIQFGSRLIVRDGNHRVVAEKLRGSPKMTARVVFVSDSK